MSNSLLDTVVGYFLGLQTLGLHMEKILLVVLTEMKQEMKIWGFLDFQYCSDPQKLPSLLN